MSSIGLIILIIFGIIGLVVLYKLLKPYFIKYDNTICITGGLGSGKTLTAVKLSVVLLRKMRIKIYWVNKWRSFVNPIKNRKNARRLKYNLKHKDDTNFKEKKLVKIKPILNVKPKLYSNIPIHFKKHLFSGIREWNETLLASHILLLEEIPEYSIVFIDELPQFINQFNWNAEIIQKNVNEFITYFRHYIGSYFITTAQSQDDVVVQIRRKLNQAIWCYHFRKWGIYPFQFYTIRMCDIMLSDSIQTMSTTYIEDNTKVYFGLFPPKGTYDTRCYSERYKNIYKAYEKKPKWKSLKTNKVLRLIKYTSPLDDKTTKEQKTEQWKKGEEIWKN